MLKYLLAGTCAAVLALMLYQPEKPQFLFSLPAFESINLDGKVVTESALRQGGVVHFFRSTCGYCVMELAGWRIFKRQHPDIKLIAVLHKETIENAKVFFKNGVYPFDEVIYDPGEVLWEHLGAEYTPQTWFFNKDLESTLKFGVMSMDDFLTLSKAVS